MKVVITGGAGFLGMRLARALLQRGALTDGHGQNQPITRLTLVDVTEPPAALNDDRIARTTGDISDHSLLKSIIDRETGSIFHLAAIVSGMAEADFDLGMRINVDATRALLETARAAGHQPRVVFTSSVAVYGGELPALITDTTALNPQTSYGIEKAIGELLVGDYTRKGFVDGRSLRLPTITVRPGRPNAAASSFASGVIREPLNGEDGICPVGADARMWVASPRTAIACLIAAHDLPSTALGNRRSLNVPGLSVSVGEMVASLERIAGAEVARRVRWEPDARIERMVRGWPGKLDNSRAVSLGFPVDDSFDSIVRSYIEEDLGRGLAAGVTRGMS
jgi:nucleoside-diphosphate-sugar epimerase